MVGSPCSGYLILMTVSFQFLGPPIFFFISFQNLFSTFQSSNPIEFVNNTRKRKMSSQEATTSSELCLKVKANTESNGILPNFLKSPSFRLNTLIQKKENENKRIGVWLSTSLKQFSKPLISTELMNFCRIIPNNFQLEEPLTTKLPKTKRFNGQNIIDEINERIGQNVLEWIENSLNSF